MRWNDFQGQVFDWLLRAFGREVAESPRERNLRFFEEASELVQAAGMSREDAHRLVDHVFDRPVGQLVQEVGGVMVTLAALCSARQVDLKTAAELEGCRCLAKTDEIRRKHAAKPREVRDS